MVCDASLFNLQGTISSALIAATCLSYHNRFRLSRPFSNFFKFFLISRPIQFWPLSRALDYYISPLPFCQYLFFFFSTFFSKYFISSTALNCAIKSTETDQKIYLYHNGPYVHVLSHNCTPNTIHIIDQYISIRHMIIDLV